jgi:hypothetical protein
VNNKQILRNIIRGLLILPVLHSGMTLADTTFIPKGAIWQYLDNGSDQGITWQNKAFDDSAWASGAGQLGYGDGDEATVVSYGANSRNKHVTTYFRHQFDVADSAAFQGLSLHLLRDDGVVVYLNGVEVLRDNMALGDVGYKTYANHTVSGSAEKQYTQHNLSITALVAGTNTLAVEIHQRNASSSDISMDLALTGLDTSTGIKVIRGPYLQMRSADAMTVRWRTDLPTDSQVRFGTDPSHLDNVVNTNSQVTNHEIRLTGLSAQTQYYYSVGSGTDVLAAGNTYKFETSPTSGSHQKSRFWVIGDSGTGNSDAKAVYDAYRTKTGDTYTDLLLMLGDNAYNVGTDSDYQKGMFDMYPEILRQTPVWSTLGNHDGYSASSANESGPYYDIFSFPRQAEVGGVASGTEAYYSFNHANIHFVVLDSYHTLESTSGSETMLQWLETDLQNTNAEWIIAFWHHPPYSKGSHDSDKDRRMTKIRSQVLPIIENYGVDLVLGGHSHAYERSQFIDGHYGLSTTFDSSYVKKTGGGRTDGQGAYHKDDIGSSHSGTVYTVAGSSGKISSGSLNHNAMFLSLRELGSMILEVDGLTLNASFLNSKGETRDYFTITKGDNLGGNANTSNLIKNGSFEDFTILKDKLKSKKVKLKNWLGDSKVWTNNLGKSAIEGQYKAVLDINKKLNSLSQTITTNSGERYQISLDAYSPKKRITSSEFEVLIDNRVITTFTPTKDWASYTATFVGVGGKQLFSIRELATQNNRRGALIDNVSIYVEQHAKGL